MKTFTVNNGRVNIEEKEESGAASSVCPTTLSVAGRWSTRTAQSDTCSKLRHADRRRYVIGTDDRRDGPLAQS